MDENDEPEDDRFYVTLRVYHDDLDPDHVGRVLGLAPTTLYPRGHPALKDSRRGAWFFSSKDAVASRDFEDHIAWLLDRLEGKAAAFERLRGEGYEVEVSCYWRHAESDRNLVLTPEIMRRLVELGLLIWIDVY